MNRKQKFSMWYKVKEMHESGFNKSQISAKLGIDRATVRKYINTKEDEFIRSLTSICQMPKKLAPYQMFTKNLLVEYPFLSAAQIEDRLKENFKDLPQVCSKTVYNFVMSTRKRYDIPKVSAYSIRQYEKIVEVKYGSEAQVDFGECYLYKEDGCRVKVYFFAMVLSRSRYKYVYCQSRPFTSETANYAHELAFSYFEGIPKRIVYDQDSVFIHDENLGDFKLTQGFRQLCDKYKFETHFCRKADPESKGKIENVVKYVKYNFLKGRKFIDNESLQTACLAWLRRTGNQKRHSTTHKIPSEEWMIEKDHLLPFNGDIETPKDKLPTLNVLKDNTIRYKGNTYSVPFETYQGVDTKVIVSQQDNELLILNSDQTLLAKHLVPSSRGNYVKNNDHSRPKSKTKEKLHNTILDKLGHTDSVKLYLETLENDKSRYYYDSLRLLDRKITDDNIRFAEQTINWCSENNILNANDFIQILNYYKSRDEAMKISQKVVLPKVEMSGGKKINNRDVQPSRSSIETYERLINL
ncbi:IS21 family transposase [Halosquirtibacter laminarini]|uniref:IS21 family transposase n=4 Tax=Halosquirtibacter laminarini TaxID=3374600 RepID=A0AC61NF09_9BACT|nr:IS21 family transposase [Prolixibacteraceae bacterium]QZE13928.1 IS21 family transposase [Prolixibacteraceae bacterium]QZE14197.1 IS21 family transposase [Prolixibacteraceae bacterium]QZE15529.1 IS21 family transposase [Prolixibacteraceae bacterium]